MTDPYREPSGLPCPRCATPLVETAGVHACPHRCGEWLPVALLDGALDLAALGVAIPPVLHAACPACGLAMAARQCVDVVVDVCAAHGVWFDPGERRYFLVLYGDRIEARRVEAAEARALDAAVEQLATELAAGGMSAARRVARRLLELEQRVARLEAE